MAKVYISYSRQDADFTRSLSEELAQRGHEVLVDDTLLSVGRSWRETLDEALQSADVLVSILSSSASSSTWVMTELGAALAYARESGRMLVIPVVVDDIPIPGPVSSLQAIIDPSRDVERIAETISTAVADFVGSRAATLEKDKETRARIEANASEYVSEAVDAQTQADKRYRNLGTFWHCLGFAALIAGLTSTGIALSRAPSPSSDWTDFAYLSLRAVFSIALLGACAKYAFTLDRSFTIEALKCADRLHAIAFGKFYLQVYGQDANWSEVKEAFANWNIDRSSAFASTSAGDFDPKLLELLGQILQTARTNTSVSATR